VTLVYAVLFGVAFGSFVNAAIERIPRGASLNGRSRCDNCKRRLRAWELVPLLSYAVLRGRCASCGASIGVRTPALELLCGGAFLVAFWALVTPVAIAASAAFVAVVIALGVALEERGARS
jgi:prepilin signal peptidase PulO-like enzyme (type II secretory pathway)